jgi:arylsulfatase A-like enzyme
MDLLPTFLAMAGRPPLSGVTLDGRDITAVLEKGAASPHEALILFDNEDPVAVRTQDWKLVDGIYYRGRRFPMGALGYTELYDHRGAAGADRPENYSVGESFPQVAQAMRARLEAARKEFAPFKHADIPASFKALSAQLAHIQD